MKKFLKVLLKILIALLAVVVLFFGFMTVVEYRPADTEDLAVTGIGQEKLTLTDSHSIVTWNIGYAGLGKECDFVMDGGGKAPAPTKDMVSGYLTGITDTLASIPAEIRFIQEVDHDSSRSHGIDEITPLSLDSDAFALNYNVTFVPYPFDYIGTVHSGIYTASAYTLNNAQRISLPCPFSWPLRTANLKRCLLVSRVNIEGTDKQLVLVNFHLEAYDDGEGKIRQTEMLTHLLLDEYAKGNYVIAGGDWNQTMPDTEAIYPNTHRDLWNVGLLTWDSAPEGWQFAFDSSSPTCRLLNQVYDPTDTVGTQYYVIDGFLVSPNIRIDSVTTVDQDFANSDHNPVLMNYSFIQE